jgi:voltage-gated potassium channel
MAFQKAEKGSDFRTELYEVIFEADTSRGKAFDVILLITIMASVIVASLESVQRLGDKYGDIFLILEWIFTIFFTIEYIFRLYCVYRPLKYATSFFGVIDLLAILPTYLSLIVAGTHYLIVIRILRLLRIFRIFKLIGYLKQGQIIVAALRASRQKIIVFLFFVLLLVAVIGSILYVVEGRTNEGFSSIPQSIYWAIVTLTTVGYGDISPQTSLGKFIAAFVMILGYAIIAVPTGIVSAEFIQKHGDDSINIACRNCGKEGHERNANFCKYCGFKLDTHDY